MNKKMVAGISAVILSASTIGIAQVFAGGSVQDDGETEEKEMKKAPKVELVEKAEKAKESKEQAEDVTTIEGKRYENDEGEEMMKVDGAEPVKVEKLEEANKNVRERLSDFIAEQSESIMEQSEDPRLKQADYDEGFNYYLKANGLSEAWYDENINLMNESEAIRGDFQNLFSMKSILSHEQFVRTSHLGRQGQAKEDVEHSDQWDPTTEEMRQAHEYMTQIIHDLDVALNHDGEGKVYGVTSTLHGDKASKVKAFFSGKE